MTNQELREMDAWIAEHVMGWQWFRFRMKKTDTAKNAGKGYDRWQQLIPPGDNWHLHPKYNAIKQPQGKGQYLEDETDLSMFKPTTDRAAAMEVLEKCVQSNVAGVQGNVEIFQEPMNGLFGICYTAAYKKKSIEPVFAETLPLAICLFSRKLFSQ